MCVHEEEEVLSIRNSWMPQDGELKRGGSCTVSTLQQGEGWGIRVIELPLILSLLQGKLLQLLLYTAWEDPVVALHTIGGGLPMGSDAGWKDKADQQSHFLAHVF